MKQTTMLLLLILLNVKFVFAQQNQQLNLDNRPARSVSGYVNAMRKTAFRLEYTPLMSFFNSTYYQNHADGIIKHKGGYGITIQQGIWLFRLDIGGFYQQYEIKDAAYKDYYGVDDAVSWGADVFAVYNPMPDWGKFSEIFSPYIGIGYQTASLKATKSKNNDSSAGKETLGSIGIGGAAWKAGLNINISKSFFIFGEYKQSINMNSSKALRMVSVGLGGGF